MSQLPIDLFFEGSSASSSSEQLSTLNRISSTNENASNSEMPVMNAIQVPDLGPDSTDSTIQINNFLESRDASNLVSSSGDNDSSTVVENSDSNSKPKSKIKRKSPRLGLKSNNSSTNSMILESSPVIIEAKGTEEPSDNGPHGVVQRGGEKVFIEPKLAEPHPAYTGLPLESFPNTKIKKESLWSTRGLSRKSNRMNGTNNNNSSVSRESSAPAQANETENDNESIELDYKANLQTSIAEEIAVESDIRPPPKRGRPSKKRGRPKADANKNITKTPKQTKVKNNNEPLLLRSSKRIKVISPKKTTSTNLAPSSVTDSGINNYSNDDPTKNNDDFCTTCGGPGVFICCDTCPKSFHFTCCNPPLEECPEDNWHCQECVIKQNPGFKKTYNHIGIFGQLLNQLEGRNPKEFQLPRKIRDNSFIGVTTGENGVYQDATFKPEISYTKMNEYQIIGFNKNTDLDVDGLYDKNGNPYLCHKCGLSGLKGKTLTHCDYCPLVWHIDCLEDPLCIPKTLGSKWRCPNHFEELLPEGLFSRRKFKDMSVLDISLHNHFLKIASMNNIIIKHNDQQFLKEDIDKSVPLHEYIQYETEDFSRLYINEQKNDESTESSNTNNSDEIHPNFKIPEFFQNYATPIGSTARASKRLNRIMTMTNTDNDGSEARAFIYRVPEKLILLNFISKVSKNEDTNALQHEKVSTDKRTILETIDDYETRGRLEESNQDERDIVDSLIHIKSEINQKKPKTKFSDLVAAALESVRYSNNEAPTKLNDEEVSDLLDIKRLVELKGKDELLKFLQS
ncbi:unnamed protein product [Debaryomyces tyrocola]|nr:unnamed protein product [Debaryomyces tyrocola]